MRYRVILSDDLTADLKELTYAELLREVECRIFDCIVNDLSGFEITFLEEVEDEGQSSEDFKVGQH